MINSKVTPILIAIHFIIEVSWAGNQWMHFEGIVCNINRKITLLMNNN